MALSINLDIKTRKKAEEEISNLYLDKYQDKDDYLERIHDILKDTENLFEGNYKNYVECKNKYHNFEHTLQATVTNSRILYGLDIPRRLFLLGVTAGLLHDSGYILTREESKKVNTGASFTKTHVNRSAEFIEEFLWDKKYSEPDMLFVQKSILTTGVVPDLKHIHFYTTEERRAALSLGVGDLFGQMAASNYIEKLPQLYEEFQEGQVNGFNSIEELIDKTPWFWEITKHRLINDYESVHYNLNNWQENGLEIYINAIEKNIEKCTN